MRSSLLMGGKRGKINKKITKVRKKKKKKGVDLFFLFFFSCKGGRMLRC